MLEARLIQGFTEAKMKHKGNIRSMPFPGGQTWQGLLWNRDQGHEDSRLKFLGIWLFPLGCGC